MTTHNPGSPVNPAPRAPRGWLRLADHDIDEATAQTVRRGWARQWVEAATAGALAAALLIVAQDVLSEWEFAPSLPAAITHVGAAAIVLGMLLGVALVTAEYVVVWLGETVRGQCPRPVGIAATGIAAAGAGLSVVAWVRGLPAVSGWLADSFTAQSEVLAGTATAPVMSVGTATHVAAMVPWLAAALGIAVTILHGPLSGPVDNRTAGGRLDYRTVDATAYLPAAVIKQYRNTQRGTSRG
ncbi:hypothetical protein [uncultured Gordonia sp.]|uniref:hypothetical protein n=1 Tax=uncultured Gordonia sp. TaxID=198437 RepID=UPI0025973C26|nr:hypothetical protein [uncultured Gordonia sp.]